MMDRFRSCTAYSIGCAIVWTVLIVVGFVTRKTSTQPTVLYVMLGLAIVADVQPIAKCVYPPPKKYRKTVE